MVSFIFCINELREGASTTPAQDCNGQWVPTDAPGANVIVPGGATNVWWLCDGTQIKVLDDTRLLRKMTLYKTYSMFFCDGKAFLVLRGNATNTTQDEGWLPLSFEHDEGDYSSYLTNAKFEPALHFRRTDQKWVKMLLPDVYHGRREASVPYGGLKGELPIFLALVAFAIPMDRLQQDLPAMFHTSAWQQYEMANGRVHKRGVVVEVYTYTSRSRAASSEADLRSFEEKGMYYP